MPEHDFRVTNRRSIDERMREAGPAAAGIWMLSGSWSCAAGTDGWVAAHYVKSWPGGGAAAKKLVSVGLWSEHRRGTQDGWLFNQQEWLDEQRLAAEVEKERQDAAARARRHRQQRKDKDLQESGQLTTGPMVVPPPDEPDPDEDDVTLSVTRDAHRTSRLSVTPNVTDMRHGERALLPSPSPSLEGGWVEEEGSRSERADPPASSSQTPQADEPAPPAPQPQRSAHGQFVDWLRWMARDDLVALDRRCELHAQDPPGTRTPACTDCQRRRRAIEQVVEAQRFDEQRAITNTSVRRRVCPDCDESGYRLGPDGSTVEPLARCEHPRVPLTAAALTGAAP